LAQACGRVMSVAARSAPPSCGPECMEDISAAITYWAEKHDSLARDVELFHQLWNQMPQDIQKLTKKHESLARELEAQRDARKVEEAERRRSAEAFDLRLKQLSEKACAKEDRSEGYLASRNFDSQAGTPKEGGDRQQDTQLMHLDCAVQAVMDSVKHLQDRQNADGEKIARLTDLTEGLACSVQDEVASISTNLSDLTEGVALRLKESEEHFRAELSSAVAAGASDAETSAGSSDVQVFSGAFKNFQIQVNTEFERLSDDLSSWQQTVKDMETRFERQEEEVESWHSQLSRDVQHFASRLEVVDRETSRTEPDQWKPAVWSLESKIAEIIEAGTSTDKRIEESAKKQDVFSAKVMEQASKLSMLETSLNLFRNEENSVKAEMARLRNEIIRVSRLEVETAKMVTDLATRTEVTEGSTAHSISSEPFLDSSKLSLPPGSPPRSPGQLLEPKTASSSNTRRSSLTKTASASPLCTMSSPQLNPKHLQAVSYTAPMRRPAAEGLRHPSLVLSPRRETSPATSPVLPVAVNRTPPVSRRPCPAAGTLGSSSVAPTSACVPANSGHMVPANRLPQGGRVHDDVSIGETASNVMRTSCCNLGDAPTSFGNEVRRHVNRLDTFM